MFDDMDVGIEEGEQWDDSGKEGSEEASVRTEDEGEDGSAAATPVVMD